MQTPLLKEQSKKPQNSENNKPAIPFDTAGFGLFCCLSFSVFDYFKKFKVNALFAYLYDLDFGSVSDVYHVFHVVYALVGKFGNMDKPVFTGGEFAERTDLR